MACATSLGGADRADLRVEGARITVVAPSGLCVDPQSLDVRRAGGFLLISDCALFAEAPGPVEGLNGVISVAISTGGLPESLEELEAFLTGPARVALGVSGRGEDVTILATRQRPDTLAIKVRDAGPLPVPGTSDTFWRILFPAGPRLVTAVLTPFEGAPLSDAAALGLLDDLVRNTQAANPPAAASPVTGADASG